MKIYRLRAKINVLLPGALFSEMDEDYYSIQWDDHRRKPEIHEIEAVTPEELDEADYAQLRRVEYQSMGDQMDAILKHFRWTNGIVNPSSIHPELAKVLDHHKEVKRKYRKPRAR